MSRAMASTLDSAVGEILSTLKATRVYDKSIIVFSSDNGTFLGLSAQVLGTAALVVRTTNFMNHCVSLTVRCFC